MEQAISVKHLKEFEYNFDIFKHPFLVFIYYDEENNKAVDMKFIRFLNRDTTEEHLECQDSGHGKGAWIVNRTRFYCDQIPKGLRPFSLYLSVCMKCGLPHIAEFLNYIADPTRLAKVKDAGRILSSEKETKELTSTLSNGSRRVTMKGK